MDEPFKALKNKIQKNHSEFDISRIQKAYELSKSVHEGQKRKSGEPYIHHPVAVADIIYNIGGDESMICAALLHDTIEEAGDTEVVRKAIREGFGIDVRFLVEALSKDGNIEDKISQQADYFARVEEALKIDIAIFFLKMADLIHNMKTISSLPPKRQENWVRELKHMYMPLMSRNFHKISLHHHVPYMNLMNELESVIEAHSCEQEQAK